MIRKGVSNVKIGGKLCYRKRKKSGLEAEVNLIHTRSRGKTSVAKCISMARKEVREVA